MSGQNEMAGVTSPAPVAAAGADTLPPQPAAARRRRGPSRYWTEERLAEVVAIINRVGIKRGAAQINKHENSVRMALSRAGYRTQWVRVR